MTHTHRNLIAAKFRRRFFAIASDSPALVAAAGRGWLGRWVSSRADREFESPLVRQLVCCFYRKIWLSGIAAHYPGVSLREFRHNRLQRAQFGLSHGLLHAIFSGSHSRGSVLSNEEYGAKEYRLRRVYTPAWHRRSFVALIGSRMVLSSKVDASMTRGARPHIVAGPDHRPAYAQSGG